MKSAFSLILLISCFLTSWGQSATDTTNGRVFTVVEEPASPLCGMTAFFKSISDEFKYPKEAKDKGITGRVFVEFVVNQDGSLSDYHVVKGIGGGCDEEAIRIVMKSKETCSWRPAQKDGVPKKSRFVIPIKFGVK